MGRQKISGTNFVPSTPLAHSGVEEAIHLQLHAMDREELSGNRPPVMTNAHEKIRQRLFARATSAEASTGYPAISKNTSSHTGDKRYTVKITDSQQTSTAILLERTQSEVELHLLLESHFQCMASGPVPDQTSAPVHQTEQDPQAGNAIRPSNITLPTILAQTGHICKPTALANIDQYYATLFNVPPIPLRKNGKAKAATPETQTSRAPATTSVREIAKSHRSRQGEVLDAADYAGIAEEMGYGVERFSPKNVDEFLALVAKHLQRRQPLTTCFAVDASTGRPTSHYQDNEHACVITGINPADRTLEIAHWGRTFSGVPIDDMYASMNALPATREQECYFDEKNCHSGRPANPQNYKYDKCTPGQTSTVSRPVVKSITPQANTGFKNRVFVMEPMLMHARWSSMPTA